MPGKPHDSEIFVFTCFDRNSEGSNPSVNLKNLNVWHLDIFRPFIRRMTDTIVHVHHVTHIRQLIYDLNPCSFPRVAAMFS